MTVALVDDQRLLREGLRTLLELQPDVRVIGEASDGIEAEALVARLQPRVMLMDLRMPRRDGVEATQRITSRWPGVRILVLTTYDDDQLVFAALDAGAAGYLLKDVGSDALADAIRAASRGEAPLQPRIAGKVLRRLRSHRGNAARLQNAVDLTARETEVLRLLGTGATNREIAERLVLTDGTVKNYISAILSKTGLHDRTQAALYAVQHGVS
ncbi:MAG: response regulator transcription factor [Chloroflexi bacterium]|nr:response regulator transcription factor [Chloroflexota bacterium]